MDIMKMGKNPNYLGSWDLEDVPNHELTLTIKEIAEEKVVTQTQQEIVAVCRFKEDYKPMILNPTNKKRLVKLYKTRDSDKLAGKRITITTEKVRAFGDIHDALRIKTVVPPAVKKQTSAVKCESCGKPIEPRSNMTAEQFAEYTKHNTGKALCWECATAMASRARESEKKGAEVNANDNNG